MKRDLLELLLGIGVLALGLVVLLFVLSNALALAQNPGAFLQGQMSGGQTAPPSASFDWSSVDRDVAFADTSRAGTSPIASRAWDFGDGNRSTAQSPTHSYAGPGVFQASLVVEDQTGVRSTAIGQGEVVAGALRCGRGAGAGRPGSGGARGECQLQPGGHPPPARGRLPHLRPVPRHGGPRRDDPEGGLGPRQAEAGDDQGPTQARTPDPGVRGG